MGTVADSIHICATCGVRLYRKPGPGAWPKYCPDHQTRRNPMKKSAFTQQLVEDHRARGCAVCGLTEPRFLIHLHHVDPRGKEANIALMRLWRPERAITELAKTVPLCANHHAIVHYELKHDCFGMAFDELLDVVRKKYPHTMMYRCGT